MYSLQKASSSILAFVKMLDSRRFRILIPFLINVMQLIDDNNNQYGIYTL